MPIEPERPAIFTTPVKELTTHEIVMMPALLRNHEIAVKAYHKALQEYYLDREHETTGSFGPFKKGHAGMGSGTTMAFWAINKLFTKFLRYARIV
jgi:hypothetical protein